MKTKTYNDIHVYGKSKDADDLLQTTYDTAAGAGRVFNTISTIVGCFIAFVLLMIGIGLLFVKQSKTNATIIAIDNNYTTITVEYQCKNQTRQDTINIVSNGQSYTNYKVGDVISIEYNETTCDHATIASNISTKSLGTGLILFALLLFVIIYAWYYLVNHSKPIAAVTGVAGVANIVRAAF